MPPSILVPISWKGGANTRVTGNTIKKIGGTNNTWNSGQTASTPLNSNNFLLFSAKTQSEVNFGISTTSGFDTGCYTTVCGVEEYGYFWILSKGDCQVFLREYNAGMGKGSYTDNTVFGIRIDDKDIQDEDGNITGTIKEIVFYKDYIEVQRDPLVGGNTINVNISNYEAEVFNIHMINKLYTKPKNLTFYIPPDDIKSNSFNVSWSGGDGATSYTYTVNGVSVTPSTDNGISSKSATFTGLDATKEEYVVVVTAKDGAVLISSEPLTVVKMKPTNITFKNITSNSFDVSWNGGYEATTYTYELNGSSVTPSVDNGVSSKSATFTELDEATEYFLIIKAVKEIEDNSGERTSLSASVETLGAPKSGGDRVGGYRRTRRVMKKQRKGTYRYYRKRG